MSIVQSAVYRLSKTVEIFGFSKEFCQIALPVLLPHSEMLIKPQLSLK